MAVSGAGTPFLQSRIKNQESRIHSDGIDLGGRSRSPCDSQVCVCCSFWPVSFLHSAAAPPIPPAPAPRYRRPQVAPGAMADRRAAEVRPSAQPFQYPTASLTTATGTTWSRPPAELAPEAAAI